MLYTEFFWKRFSCCFEFTHLHTLWLAVAHRLVIKTNFICYFNSLIIKYWHKIEVKICLCIPTLKNERHPMVFINLSWMFSVEMCILSSWYTVRDGYQVISVNKKKIYAFIMFWNNYHKVESPVHCVFHNGNVVETLYQFHFISWKLIWVSIPICCSKQFKMEAS